MNDELLNIKVNSLNELEKLKQRLTMAKLYVSYENVQGQKELNSFDLGFNF